MNLLFYLSSVVAVIATILVISRSNAVHALLYLIVSLLSVALIFFALGAPFVAMLEVLIYAGAIMVLFVILIMLTDVGSFEPGQRAQTLVRSCSVVVAVIFLAVMTIMSTSAPMRGKQAWSSWAEVEPGTIEKIGGQLFTTYMMPFEALSLLLVAAVVAALFLTRREEKE